MNDVKLLCASLHARAGDQAWRDKQGMAVQDAQLHKPGIDMLAEHMQSKIADGVHLLETAADAAAAAHLPSPDLSLKMLPPSVDGVRASENLHGTGDTMFEMDSS